MSNNKQIEKSLEPKHQETIVGINTIQTKSFDNQKTENMSNNKQSSVEWLAKEFHISTDSPLVIQAKAMHKEEVIDFASEWSVCQLRSDKIWHLDDLYAIKFSNPEPTAESVASQILMKHEDENEYHFHESDRKFIIEAMKEFAVYVSKKEKRK